MSFPTGTRLGPYEILDAIGAGGMGEVYKARDTRLDRTVAIKILPSTDPDRRERFAREARAIAALSHPHICVLHDVGAAASSDPARPVDFIVMESRGRVAGRSEGRSAAAGDLDRPGAADRRALDAAHEADAVHRDLATQYLRHQAWPGEGARFRPARSAPPAGDAAASVRRRGPPIAIHGSRNDDGHGCLCRRNRHAEPHRYTQRHFLVRRCVRDGD